MFPVLLVTLSSQCLLVHACCAVHAGLSVSGLQNVKAVTDISNMPWEVRHEEPFLL